MRTIVFEPGKPTGEYREFPGIEEVFDFVDGYVEPLFLPDGCAALVDDDGMIHGLAPSVNLIGGYRTITLVGNVVVVGVANDQFTDVKDSAKKYFNKEVV